MLKRTADLWRGKLLAQRPTQISCHGTFSIVLGWAEMDDTVVRKPSAMKRTEASDINPEDTKDTNDFTKRNLRSRPLILNLGCLYSVRDLCVCVLKLASLTAARPRSDPGSEHDKICHSFHNLSYNAIHAIRPSLVVGSSSLSPPTPTTTPSQ
jgi:hypothetical protein